MPEKRPVVHPIDDTAWHALTAQKTLQHLKVVENGLTAVEAAERIAVYGPNQLTEAPRPGFLAMLWEQFNNFIVILLIVASIISAFLGEWIDASAIMTIVILNAVLGIVQERRAEEASGCPQETGCPGSPRHARWKTTDRLLPRPGTG